jgi:hypothetical protein
MIKDKITPEIKDKFKKSIDLTIKTGKEHAFIICRNDKEEFFPRPICEGRECIVTMEPPESCLPFRAQGNFHTHADVAIARRLSKDKGNFSRERLTDYVREVAYLESVDITTPSHGDLINALVNKCLRRTEGTVCVGSDAVSDRVDCYTTNNKITKDDCHKAKMSKFFMRTEEAGLPKPWIKPLFDKEIINL